MRYFCRLLIPFVNGLDPSKPFDTLIVFLNVLKKLILKKVSIQQKKKHGKYPVYKELKWVQASPVSLRYVLEQNALTLA